MPRAIPLATRQAVLRGGQRGLSPQTLAQRFHLPVRTVYHLLRQGRLQGQAQPPAYHRPPQARRPPRPSSCKPRPFASSTTTGAAR
jgi:transposase